MVRGINMHICHLNIILICLALTATVESSNAAIKSASAYCKNKQCTFTLDKLDWKSATAVATFNDSLFTSGWGVLDISSGFGPDQDDEDIMYAAGFLEGLLTSKQMESQYTNIYGTFIKNAPNPVLVSKLNKWFTEQREWTNSMITAHKGSSALWRHVAYLLAQLDGLLAGYQNSPESNNRIIDVFAVNFLQANGDMLDLVSVVDPSSIVDWTKFTPAEAMEYVSSTGHCSALIKILPWQRNFYFAHSTWFTYQGTNRIYKHYNFNVKDSATAARKLSFSSYGGNLESLDDFYLLGSGMVMLQTSNNIFNKTLYSQVKVNSLFAWQRVRLANMMAHNGEEWTTVFAEHNSGTYNNQYMVFDLKKVNILEPVQANTLWVAEQIPGLVVAKDLTDHLLRQGYFPSYNVPYFPEIFNKSGYPEFVKKFGDQYTYENAPRAKIFRRDQGHIVNITSIKNLLRSNDYLSDPYSEGNPMFAVCSRGDLVKGSPRPFGCYDTKATDLNMARTFEAHIINGPTRGTNLKPFSWTGIFKNDSHVGLPNEFNFSFIDAKPTL